VEGLLEHGPPPDVQSLEHQAVRANIRMSADHLRHGSQVLERLIHQDGLLVVARSTRSRPACGLLRRRAGAEP